MGIEVLLAACKTMSCGLDRSFVEGGITLISTPVSTKNCTICTMISYIEKATKIMLPSSRHQ